MIEKIFQLCSPEEANGPVPELKVRLCDDGKPHGMVVVLPGGGYAMLAPHEAEPVADTFRNFGLHSAVVRYRVSPNRFPKPQLDVLHAIQIIRHHAEEWQVKADKIAVLGFSAGGHLAASMGTIARKIELEDNSVSGLPNAVIPCYPVISSDPSFGHMGSFENLLGKENFNSENLEAMSLEKQVTKESVPAFLWHTASDDAVPVKNSLVFVDALKRCNVDFELHIFPHGPHGIGLADDFPEVAVWPELASRFLFNLGF